MIDYILDLFNQCDSCDAYCCNGDGPVYLTYGEMERLDCKEAIKTPCKFLCKDSCSIYNKRPQMCRDYPLEESEKLIVIKDIYFCPMATQIYDKLLEFLSEYYPSKMPDISGVEEGETEMAAVPVVLFRGFINWLKRVEDKT